MQQPAPRTVIVSDGHAGNRRQAEALAQALGRIGAPHVTVQPALPARALAPRTFPGAGRCLGAEFAALLQQPPVLVIGCGRQAALATRLLRQRGSCAVQILDPRISPRHWDWVIAPDHDGLRGENVLRLAGSLHPVDSRWLARARIEPGFAPLSRMPRPRVAVLLGGPGRHWKMREAALRAQLLALAGEVKKYGGSLWLVASRRTPAAWKALLRSLPAERVWCDAGDGENPYPGFLAFADALVVSADSVNMLSEAAATSVPVYALGADVLQGRPVQFLKGLQRAGRVQPWQGALIPFKVIPVRETLRVARWLAPRLPSSAPTLAAHD